MIRFRKKSTVINFRLYHLTILFLFLTFYGQPAYPDDRKDSLLDIYQNSKLKNERINAYIFLISDMFWTDLDSSGKMLDSAKRWISDEDMTENNVQLLNLYGNYFWYKQNYDSALIYYRQALKLSTVLGFKNVEIKILSNLGALHNLIGNPDSTLIYQNQALQLSNEINEQKYLPKIHLTLGSLYHNKGFDHLSLEHYFEAIKHYEKEKDTINLILAYNGIGNTYQSTGRFDDSKSYYLKALDLDLHKENIDLTNDIYNNLGVLFWLNKKEYDTARYYIKKAISSIDPETDKYDMYAYTINLGGIEMDAGNYSKGLKYLIRAKKIDIPLTNPQKQSALLVNKGIAYRRLSQYDSARYYLELGLNTALAAQANTYARNALYEFYRLDSATGDYLSAMRYLLNYKAISDSISSDKVKNKIAELNIIYETDKKEKENEFLRSKNHLNQRIINNQRILMYISMTSLIIIIIFVVLLLLNRNKLKKAYQKLEIQNQQIRQSSQIIEKQNDDLRIQKQQLTELNQTKDKFFSVVAHDLRSPFNGLLGYLDILENEFEEMDDESRLDIIKTLHQESRNTYNLTVNLLEWSRSQRGLISSNPEEIILGELAQDTLDSLAQRTKAKEQVIENNLPEDLVAFADPNLTHNILTNLLNNAIKFTPRKGKISLDGRAVNGKVEIKVTDTGIGIPSEYLKNLFSLSSGLSRTGTEEEPGTGLGLVMCREFVELMHGSIRVESVESRGTTFYISLPVYKQEN